MNLLKLIKEKMPFVSKRKYKDIAVKYAILKAYADGAMMRDDKGRMAGVIPKHLTRD